MESPRIASSDAAFEEHSSWNRDHSAGYAEPRGLSSTGSVGTGPLTWARAALRSSAARSMAQLPLWGSGEMREARLSLLVRVGRMGSLSGRWVVGIKAEAERGRRLVARVGMGSMLVVGVGVCDVEERDGRRNFAWNSASIFFHREDHFPGEPSCELYESCD